MADASLCQRQLCVSVVKSIDLRLDTVRTREPLLFYQKPNTETLQQERGQTRRDYRIFIFGGIDKKKKGCVTGGGSHEWQRHHTTEKEREIKKIFQKKKTKENEPQIRTGGGRPAGRHQLFTVGFLYRVLPSFFVFFFLPRWSLGLRSVLGDEKSNEKTNE